MKYFSNFSTVEYDMFGDGKTRQIADIFRKIRINSTYLDDITFYTYYDIPNGERPDTASYKLYGKIDFHWTFPLLNPWLLDMRQDWPMSNIEMDHYIEEKYPNTALIINDLTLASKFVIGETIQGLVSGAIGTIISKNVNLQQMIISVSSGDFSNGELIYGQTSNDYISIVSVRLHTNAIHHYELANGTVVDRFAVGAQPITNTEYEIAENDSRTRIKIIRPELIKIVTKRFIDIIKA